MNAVVKFDPVAVARTAIIREHEFAEASVKTATAHARRAGRLLLEAKRSMPHGSWMHFCNSLPFSDRTARGYMRLAEVDDSIWQRVATLSLREAMKSLAEPKAKVEVPIVDTVTLDIFPDDPQRIPAALVEQLTAMPWPAAEMAKSTAATMTATEMEEIAAATWVAPADPEQLAEALARRYPDWEFRRKSVAPLRLVGRKSTA